jgi:hypothetical protein
VGEKNTLQQREDYMKYVIYLMYEYIQTVRHVGTVASRLIYSYSAENRQDISFSAKGEYTMITS